VSEKEVEKTKERSKTSEIPLLFTSMFRRD